MLASRALPFFLVTLPSTLTVQAHGYVEAVTYQGKETTMYLPYDDPYEYPDPFPDRAARRFNGNGPVMDITSDDIRCNAYDEGTDMPAADVVSVNAGEDIVLRWTKWPIEHLGPILTYMAHCENDDCTTYQAGRDAAWFKVHEDGYDRSQYDESAEHPSAECWGATSLPGLTNYTFQIPSELRSGQYLVRHEIIALHYAVEVSDEEEDPDTVTGSQHYMQCLQFDVQSDGDAFPDENQLVAFPGAYSEDEPGLNTDVWDMPVVTYTTPGPSVWQPSQARGDPADSSTSPQTGSQDSLAEDAIDGAESFANDSGAKKCSGKLQRRHRK